MHDRRLLSHYRAPVRQLISLVLPILAAHQIGSIIPFINTILAGRHSPLWLAATGVANTVFGAIMGFGWGITTSVGILTARELGKTNEPNKTGLILKASLLTIGIISIPIMLFLQHIKPLLLFFSQPPEIAEIAQEYLNGLLWIVPIDFGRFSLFQFAIAHHRVMALLIATAVSIPLILFFNVMLTPYLGVCGIGLGTAIACWIIFIILLGYFYKDRVFGSCLSVHSSFKHYMRLSATQFELGIPMGAMSSIELLFFVIIGLWAGRISTDHLIAHQISMQWLCFTIVASVSFSEAITILMAKCTQEDSYNKMRVLKAGVYLSGICMTLISFLYWVAPNVLIRLDLGTYVDSPNLIYVSTTTLALCGIFQIVDGMRIALSGGLRGLADTTYPMWITLFAFWGIGLPIAYITTFVFHWQQVGLWFGMTCAIVAMVALQYSRIHTLLKSTE